jgi:ubiquinone/menaquinone biosynthesis C-methylase UbiE
MHQRRSQIAHRGLPFNCPHSSQDVKIILSHLSLPSNPRILDLGCGRGELLKILQEKFGGHGVAVGKSKDMLDHVQGNYLEKVELDLVEFIEKNAGFGCLYRFFIGREAGNAN